VARVFVCALSLALFASGSVLADNILVRDPTQPVDYVPSATETVSGGNSGYRLSGIFESSRPAALINGKRYHVGETIDGYTVKSIRPSKVVLQKDDEQMELSLYSSKVIVR
jgi:hypothetical protein